MEIANTGYDFTSPHVKHNLPTEEVREGCCVVNEARIMKLLIYLQCGYQCKAATSCSRLSRLSSPAHLSPPLLSFSTTPSLFSSSPCHLSSSSISSTSPGSVVLDAPLWGLTGGLHPSFWSLSVVSDVAPPGLWAVLTFPRGPPVSRPSEHPWREAQGNIDIFYHQKQLTSFCVQYVCVYICLIDVCFPCCPVVF